MSTMNTKLAGALSAAEHAHRTNSFAIDLSTVYSRDQLPNRLEMFKFIHKQLGLKTEEIVDISSHTFLPQVYVKVKTEQILDRVEARMMQGVKVYQKDVTLYGWRCGVPIITARIHNTNYDTSEERIKEVMTKYGEVISLERGRVDYFKTGFVSDGTWLIRIQPQQGKGLPSIIYYEDERKNIDVWAVNFDGKVFACWKCGGQNHRGDTCRSTRPKPGQELTVAPVGLGTYCDVVKQGVDEEWVGMSNTRMQSFSKQKTLKGKNVQEGRRNEGVPARKEAPAPSPLSLSAGWRQVTNKVVARSKHVSMVAHTCGDVSLAINTKNSFSVLAHTVQVEPEITGEESEEDPMEIDEAERKGSKRARTSPSKPQRKARKKKLDSEDTIPEVPGVEEEVVVSDSPGGEEECDEEVPSVNLLEGESKQSEETLYEGQSQLQDDPSQSTKTASCEIVAAAGAEGQPLAGTGRGGRKAGSEGRKHSERTRMVGGFPLSMKSPRGGGTETGPNTHPLISPASEMAETESMKNI